MTKLYKQSSFGSTPNKLLNNPSVSWKAKGLYAYIDSKPNEWDFSIDRVALDAKDGRDSTRAGIQELENAGYLQRIQRKADDGSWDYDWYLHWSPMSKTDASRDGKSDDGKSDDGKLITATENPTTENPTNKKERNIKKDIYMLESNIKHKDLLSDEDKKNTEKKVFENEKLNHVFEEFIENRKQMGKKMTPLAIKKATKRIEAMLSTHSVEEIVSYIERAIESNWQSIYEISSKNAGQKGKMAYETCDRNNFVF